MFGLARLNRGEYVRVAMRCGTRVEVPPAGADERGLAVRHFKENVMNSITNGASAGCGGCALDRREFLARCAACAAGAGGLAMLAPRRAAAAEPTARPKVRLVFTHIPSTGPIWPNIGYDFDKRKKELTEQLAAACPGIEFRPVTVQNTDEAAKVLADDAQVDGYVVYTLGLWTGAPQMIGAAGRPTVFVDDLYGGSGEFLIANAAARRAGQKVVGVSSSRLEDVAGVVRGFDVLKQPGKTVDDFLAAGNTAWKKGIKRSGDMSCAKDEVRISDPAKCLARLKDSTMLVVGAWNEPLAKAIQDVFGTKVKQIEFPELDGLYQQANRDEAAEFAERWVKGAEKLIEPSRDDVVQSGAMYGAMRELMKRNNAQAISINCLGGFYGGHIKAYPCLGFCQFNNDGLVGACEADMISTITMLTMGYLTARPGYISDPVIDTSKNQIIYAHCVAPTKMFGPDGAANPYHIRSHSEDRKGAVVRSLMPLGHMTTTVEFHPLRKEVLFHQARTVANIDEDKACRSKLAAEVVGDIDRLMCEWDQWSWHRVTVYGDLKEPVAEMAKALGMKVVKEA